MSFSSFLSGQYSQLFTIPSIACSTLNVRQATAPGSVLTDVNGTGQVSWRVPSAGALDFADFYALMPGDNAGTVALGANVLFPQAGPRKSTTGIIMTAPGVFQLSAIGVYKVDWQVSIDEPGQLVLTLAGAVLPYTVAGRATGTSQIVGSCLVQTTLVNELLTLQNPAGNAAALTVTPIAGGASSVSAHLVVTRLQ